MGSYGKAATPAIPLPELPRPSRAARWIGNLEEKEEALSVHRRFRLQWPRGHVSRQNGAFVLFAPKRRSTRRACAMTAPACGSHATHAPNVSLSLMRRASTDSTRAHRRYWRLKHHLLVATFATHFLLPKSGLRCKKSGHGSGRAPVTPGLPFRYLHYLHGQLSTS